MRIAVMGAGGVGGCLGALLALDGNEVSLIARGDHLAEIRARGLRLKQGDSEFVVGVRATADPREIGPVDLLLFTVKTYHNGEAIPAARPLAGPDTLILTLQNGVESHLQLAEGLGTGSVLPGAYWTASTVDSPGVISCIGQAPRLSFGHEDSALYPRLEGLRVLFESAGIDAELSPDPLRVIWSKFVVLCSLAGITSAADTRIKEFIGYPEGRRLFVEAMTEVDAVGRAKGVNLPTELVENSLDFIDGYPDFQNSMHADFEHGRRTELEALNGSVVRLGWEAGVATPVNDFIYAVLSPRKDGVLGLSS